MEELVRKSHELIIALYRADDTASRKKKLKLPWQEIEKLQEVLESLNENP